MKDGFIKVAAASPPIRVADADYNVGQILECLRRADRQGVKLLVLPELVLTGVSACDLNGHRVVLQGAERALERILAASRGMDMLVLLGLPVAWGARLMSCAAALYKGELLGLIPQSGCLDREVELSYAGFTVPLSDKLLLTHRAIPGLSVAVEIGEDMDAPIGPAMVHCQAGATVIARLAGFPATLDSTRDAAADCRVLSKRICCAMLLAAPGRGESSTDNSYTGLCLAAEAGRILKQSEGEDSFLLTELDVEYLVELRRQAGGFEGGSDYGERFWGGEAEETLLTRRYSKTPCLPDDPLRQENCCRRILDLQVSGLIKRMRYAGLDHCVVGVSGGSDSTLAVMVCALALKRMSLPPQNLLAVTMPCFGTSSRTRNNAVQLARECGAELRVIDISEAVNRHFDDIGHDRGDYSIAYENAQARMRTMVLMDLANKVNGLNVGTEDMSEYIDGWCTYNGDHISMYDVNLGLMKSQVLAVLRFVARKTESDALRQVLEDVLDCPITPELLPIFDDKIEQCSEAAVGPYILQDFFSYQILFCGFGPAKTLRLAKLAYGDSYSEEELRRWLQSYCKRLFSQQFKRSVLNDGPAVNRFSLSPRNGFRMPSDAEAALFLRELENR